ncbi:MAG: hypothetical protein R2716_12590 [Microthrixaceae bacterium]
MPATFSFDDRWRFPVARSELWQTLQRTDRYQEWWDWLREFDGAPLQPGERADAVIDPPLPYSLSVRITLVDVVPERTIEAAVTGDLDGSATLELHDGPAHSADTCCDARLVWHLSLRHRLVGPTAWMLRPVLEWGHRWVINTGMRQFRTNALPDTEPPAGDDS